MTDMTVHELLVEGRNVVARGWCQDMLHTVEADQHCALGGLARAVVGDDRMICGWSGVGSYVVVPALAALDAAIPDDQRPPQRHIVRLGATSAWDRVVAWNNAPGRAQAEVLAAFDAAIAATAPAPADPLTEVDAREVVAA